MSGGVVMHAHFQLWRVKTKLLVIDVLIERLNDDVNQSILVGCVKNSLLSNLKINNYAMLFWQIFSLFLISYKTYISFYKVFFGTTNI